MGEINLGSKSPLASNTLQAVVLHLAIQAIGLWYPTVGDWLEAHKVEVLSVFSAAIVYGRHTADKPLDWKNWTIGGIGIKF